MNPFGVDDSRQEIAKAESRSQGNPSGGRRLTHVAAGPFHTLATSRKDRRVKNVARDVGSGYAGALGGAVAGGIPGAMMQARGIGHVMQGGSSSKGRAMVAGGQALMYGGAIGGSQAARQANLSSMNRKGYLKKEER